MMAFRAVPSGLTLRCPRTFKGPIMGPAMLAAAFRPSHFSISRRFEKSSSKFLCIMHLPLVVQEKLGRVQQSPLEILQSLDAIANRHVRQLARSFTEDSLRHLGFFRLWESRERAQEKFFDRLRVGFTRLHHLLYGAATLGLHAIGHSGRTHH